MTTERSPQAHLLAKQQLSRPPTSTKVRTTSSDARSHEGPHGAQHRSHNGLKSRRGSREPFAPPIQSGQGAAIDKRVYAMPSSTGTKPVIVKSLRTIAMSNLNPSSHGKVAAAIRKPAPSHQANWNRPNDSLALGWYRPSPPQASRDSDADSRREPSALPRLSDAAAEAQQSPYGRDGAKPGVGSKVIGVGRKVTDVAWRSVKRMLVVMASIVVIAVVLGALGGSIFLIHYIIRLRLRTPCLRGGMGCD
ncbi:hypothetical protein LTR53_001285 [Teratosphaeriaceae sp. CCFEE 6253]|nr:hypothetical protein LTR53_001285 [Teratosphaeriaceae sp. CCFEE 6253]